MCLRLEQQSSSCRGYGVGYIRHTQSTCLSSSLLSLPTLPVPFPESQHHEQAPHLDKPPPHQPPTSRMKGRNKVFHSQPRRHDWPDTPPSLRAVVTLCLRRACADLDRGEKTRDRPGDGRGCSHRRAQQQSCSQQWTAKKRGRGDRGDRASASKKRRLTKVESHETATSSASSTSYWPPPGPPHPMGAAPEKPSQFCLSRLQKCILQGTRREDPPSPIPQSPPMLDCFGLLLPSPAGWPDFYLLLVCVFGS